jgi:hypothetical protein
MSSEQLLLSFPDESAAEASRLAAELRDFIAESTPNARAELQRSDEHAMDFGATLAVVLGTPAAIALANGIAGWLKRRGDPALVIATKRGTIVVARDLPADAKKEVILAALASGDV